MASTLPPSQEEVRRGTPQGRDHRRGHGKQVVTPSASQHNWGFELCFRYENGPEYTREALLCRAKRWGMTLSDMQPGQPAAECLYRAI